MRHCHHGHGGSEQLPQYCSFADSDCVHLTFSCAAVSQVILGCVLGGHCIMSHFSSDRLNRSSQGAFGTGISGSSGFGAGTGLKEAEAVGKQTNHYEPLRIIPKPYLSWFSTKCRACLSPKHFRLLLAEVKSKCQRLAFL